MEKRKGERIVGVQSLKPQVKGCLCLRPWPQAHYVGMLWVLGTFEANMTSLKEVLCNEGSLLTSDLA